MKTFYTVRDIEDMHAAGVVEIQTHDDVVVTDVAREKAISFGMRLISAEEAGESRPEVGANRPPAVPQPGKPAPSAAAAFPKPAASASTSSFPSPSGPGDAELIAKVKAGVIARLGTSKYNDLLDKIIPQVMSQLKK